MQFNFGRGIFILLINLLFLTTAYSAPVKPWTVLIFMNANNNLSQYGVQNIKDMESVGSDQNINIVTQWSSEDAGKAVRMLIQKDTSASPDITSPILEDLGKVDMGDYRNLEDFIQWGVQHFPAKHYFIIVWDHGMGWHASPAQIAITRDISRDQNTGSIITTEQLAESMAYAAQLIGHKVDIYASDACLMAMIEVADQMASSVDYFAGSQALVPWLGLPYKRWFTQWEAAPNATSTSILKMLTHAYLQSYKLSDPNRQVSFSAYDLKQLPALNEAIANLGAQIQQVSLQDKPTVIAAANTSLHFGAGDYVDLIDFTHQLAITNVNIDAQTIAQVQTAAKALLVSNAASESYQHHASGISIWLPTHNKYLYINNEERYQLTQFNDDTHWSDVLQYLMN